MTTNQRSVNKMAFTLEQQKAIDASGSNILISAGAGSGKTTVLSERVIRILKSGVDVDRLIILTFTNAAALEMKTRIKDKISEIDGLQEQLSKLDNAHISTFDSFCLSLVKQYHYLLNLPENVEIADNILLYSIKQRLLDETMNDFYLIKSDTFIQVIDRYFDKGDQGFRDLILLFDKSLEMIPDPENYLNHLVENNYSEAFIEQSFHEYEELVLDRFKSFKTNYDHLVDEIRDYDNDKVVELKGKLISTFSDLYGATSLDDIMMNLSVGTLPTLPKASNAIDENTVEWLKYYYNPVKESYLALKKEFDHLFVQSKSDIINALLETKNTIQVLIEVLLVYRSKVRSYQLAHHFFDFIDIMHLAIELLTHHAEVKESLKNHTFEIMVDEYQDTNDLQEYLVSLISNHNVFMVGDAKQSIYGFRNANPQNFIDKYHQYKDLNDGVAIDLTYNFRSRNEVIEGINSMFYPMMDESIGGVNYHDNQALQFGNEIYNIKSHQPILYQSEIMNYSLSKEDSISQAEYEAILIAKKIQLMIDEKTPVMNLKVKGGQYEAARFEHFCILLDRKSDFDVFEKVLTDANIVVDSISDEKVVASTEVLLFNQLLKLMKCFIDEAYFKTYFKHAFYGVARSFIYQIDDNSIIDLFVNYPLNHITDLSIFSTLPTFQQIHDDIAYLSRYITITPIKELIQMIVERLKIYHHIARLENPENVERKLDFLFAKVQSFRLFQFDDLIAYFDDVYSSKELDIEFSRPIDFSKNAVRLMTMHKSKGLEFPFCFYPGLDKTFNMRDINQGTLFDKKYGIIIKTYKEGFIDTIWHKIVRNRKKNEIISEKIRLFYVALTRTKEKMFFLLNQETSQVINVSYDESGYISSKIRSSFRKYHNFFDCFPIVEDSHVPYLEEKTRLVSNPKTPIQPVSEPLKYHEIHIEAKTISQSHYSKTVKTWMDNPTIQAVKQGIKLHKIFETFDFYHPQEALKSMHQEDAFYLKRFLAHKEFSSIDKAIIYQEYPFTLTNEDSTKMGVIDLLLIYPDHVDITDYKLKNIEDEAYIAQLNGYACFIRDLAKKPVKLYLYSILTDVLKQIGD